MEIFGRNKGQPRPAWFRGSHGEWRTFLGQVEDSLARRHKSFTFRLDEGGLALEDGSFVGLGNIAARWLQAPRAGRAAEVEKHLGKLADVREAAMAPSDLRETLRVTIYPADFMPEHDWIVRRRPCESWQAVLAVDFEGGIRLARTDELSAIGLSVEEAFETASKNNHRFEPYALERLDLPGGDPMYLIAGDSIVTSGQALDIERFVNPSCENGVVVGIPNRHTVAYVRADGKDIEASIVNLGMLVRHIWEQGEYCVSPDLVWKRGDEWQTIVRLTRSGNYEVDLLDGLLGEKG